MRDFDITTYCSAKLGPVVDDIGQFFADIVHKLAANSHKGRWPDTELKAAFDHLISEVKELRDAVLNEPDENIRMEAADIAIMAMIVSCIAIERRNNTKEPVETFDLDETFT